LGITSVASAQRSYPTVDGVRFEGHFGVAWYGGLGTGFRVDIPIVPKGFIDGVVDELVLSPGGELFFADYGYNDSHHDFDFAFAPVLPAQWNFHLHPKWSVFHELGFAMVFASHDHRRDDDHLHVYATPFIGIGGRFHLTQRIAFVSRIAWPVGFQFGINF